MKCKEFALDVIVVVVVRLHAVIKCDVCVFFSEYTAGYFNKRTENILTQSSHRHNIQKPCIVTANDVTTYFWSVTHYMWNKGVAISVWMLMGYV